MPGLFKAGVARKCEQLRKVLYLIDAIAGDIEQKRDLKGFSKGYPLTFDRAKLDLGLARAIVYRVLEQLGFPEKYEEERLRQLELRKAEELVKELKDPALRKELHRLIVNIIDEKRWREEPINYEDVFLEAFELLRVEVEDTPRGPSEPNKSSVKRDE